MKLLKDLWHDMPLKSDKGDVHSYIEVYEEILKPYRLKTGRVLEIGLFNGASLRLWEQYFINSKVYGIDCSETPHDGLADLRPMIAEGTHNIFIGDATKEADIDRCFVGIKWDIVFDDGNHNINSQLQTFEIFKNRMNKGGMIIIEDIENIDRDRRLFESLKGKFVGEIIDRRKVKKRFDDVLFIARF